MRTSSKKSTSRQQYQSISFDRIILEITNFEGFEAESEIAWKKLLNRIDYGNKKYIKTEGINKDTDFTSKRSGEPIKLQQCTSTDSGASHRMTNYKQLLANENVIVIDKTPSKLRPTTEEIKLKEENHAKTIKTSSKNLISKTEMPQPNTVRHFKDIFESLTLPIAQQHNVKKSQNLGRSQSLPKSIEKKESLNLNASVQMKNLSNENLHMNDMEIKKGNSLPSRLEIPQNIAEFQSEEEEKREWRNACSPVSPEIIQKIRQHGISMTFFGRPAYTLNNSPEINGSIEGYEEWSKSKILDMTKRYSERNTSSLCSSSTCSEDDYQYNVWENNETHCRDIFGNGYYYYSILNIQDEADRHISRDDSYDIIYLNETYSRSSTPKLGTINKGIWLKDPYWHGSSYIIYDFRGTDVKHHLDVK